MKLWLIAALASLALPGCAHLPMPSDGLGFEQRRARLESLEGWEMRGRLAVDTGERAFQGRFQWRQEAGRLWLSVRGPLGAGAVEIAGAEDALMVRARGESFELGDPERQLSDLLGWWLPVASLDAWLIGLPDRLFEADSEIDAGGLLVSLEQRLWRLDYMSYQLTEGWLLPRRIDMTHESLHLRLTVDAWRPVTAAAERLN